MSNFLAVATVSATLRNIVDEAAQSALPDVSVSVTNERPDNVNPNDGTAAVSVFLYQVTPNPHWSNMDLPTRRGDGSLVSPPQTALDLAYLLTFFGVENTRQPERLLGSVLSRLDSEPLLSRERIRQVISTDPTLATSDLDQQVDLVRFVPTSLNLEELSKLWSVFFQTAYRLSVAYRGSVVLIQPEALPRPTLPVRRPRIYVDPFRAPVIEEVLGEGADGPDALAPIVFGAPLLLRGQNLRGSDPAGSDTRVVLGAEEVEPAEAGPTVLRVVLGEPPFPAESLRAGVQGVRVAHLRMLGEPGFETEHRGVESNVAAFVLRPVIRLDGDAPLIEEGTASPPQPPPPEGEPPLPPLPTEPVLTVTVDPQVGRDQSAFLLLNRPGDSYTLPAWRRNADTNELRFPLSGVAAGTYLVRVRVDGAESPLETDGDGLYVGPSFEVTE